MSQRDQLHSLNTAASHHSQPMNSTSSHSPATKVAQPQRTSSSDSTSDAIRKRVCKACDRCRLKKSKCDGSNPCLRCKADNAICVFGERKKSHDKVYPKGYVEMLEQQQSQLVRGLRELYRKMKEKDAWDGDELSETNGHPLTHDILHALGLLEAKQDGSGDLEVFEENCQSIQSRLLAEGAALSQRRGSVSSESEHSQHGQAQSDLRDTPMLFKPAAFKDNFSFSAPPSPPASQCSPMPTYRQQPHKSSLQASQTYPLQQLQHLTSDPQLYQAEWAYTAHSNVQHLMRSKFALQIPEMDSSMPDLGEVSAFEPWDPSSAADFNPAGLTSFPQHMSMAATAGDPMMEYDFNQFIQVTS